MVRASSAAHPPRVLCMTIERYRRAFESRSGPLWEWFRRRVPALYNEQGSAGDRRRALRSDGGDSLLCVIVALLRSMDLRRGFLGRPPAGGEGRWHRRTIDELFGFAFGEPVPGALSVRRIERHLRALRELGIIVTYQVRKKGAAGFRSEPAIRVVTDRLFELAGTARQLAKERREAHKRAEQLRSAAHAARRVERIRVDSAPRASVPAPAPTGAERINPPRAGPVPVRELIDRLKLSLRRS